MEARIELKDFIVDIRPKYTLVSSRVNKCVAILDPFQQKTAEQFFYPALTATKDTGAQQQVLRQLNEFLVFAFGNTHCRHFDIPKVIARQATKKNKPVDEQKSTEEPVAEQPSQETPATEETPPPQ